MGAKMNREGMTLLEWIRAAGIRLTERATKQVQRTRERRCFGNRVYYGTKHRDPEIKGLRLLDVNARHAAAWVAGEDPTEWRAAIERGTETP